MNDNVSPKCVNSHKTDIYIATHVCVPSHHYCQHEKNLFDRVTTGTIQLSNRVKLYTNCF